MLLLREPAAPDAYPAPAIDPRRMRLSPGEDYAQTPLHLCLEQVTEDRAPPVRVEIQGDSVQQEGQPLRARALVTNELDQPLQLWLARPPYGHTGLGLWLAVSGASAASPGAPASAQTTLQVAPRSDVGDRWVCQRTHYSPLGASVHTHRQGALPARVAHRGAVAGAGRGQGQGRPARTVT